MIELGLLVVVVAAVVLAIRKGGSAEPGEPVIVRRAGQYHITLDPQLDSFRGLMEDVAHRLTESVRPEGDVPTRYFQLRRDGERADGSCLLAIAFRKGVYFIQAISPRPLQRDAASHLATIRQFSEAVLVHYPPVPPVVEHGAEVIDAAVGEGARRAGISVGRLIA